MSKAVLITTENRGVFFGYMAEGDDHAPASVTLTDGRNCIYWSDSIRGFLGLASDGPDDYCRVGPRASKFTVYGVTSIADVTPEAVARWEAAPWGA
jgi:hypothetical protein